MNTRKVLDSTLDENANSQSISAENSLWFEF